MFYSAAEILSGFSLMNLDISNFEEKQDVWDLAPTRLLSCDCLLGSLLFALCVARGQTAGVCLHLFI